MPAYSRTAGSVILQEAFALGKMHESSGWRGLLRDGCIPSDIDLYFDNNGMIIFVDLSSSYDRWDSPRTLTGQLRGYLSAIRCGPHCAALCKHSVTPEMNRKIDTLRDIETFQIMIWDFELVYSPIYDGAYWQNFVIAWMNDPKGPLRIRRTILGQHVGLIRSRPNSNPPTET